MVITADTATFELIRLASIHFYNSTQWSADEVNIRQHTDNSNSTVVQYTIKIIQPDSGYTVNIYTTTVDSSLMERDGKNLWKMTYYQYII